MRNLKILYPVIISLILFASCSVQKRNYTKGYFVEWKTKRANTKETNQVVKHDKKKKTEDFISLVSLVPETKNSSKNLVASASKTKKPKPVFTKSKTFVNPCDTIVLHNEKVITAQIIEVNENEIKYRNCNDSTGPIRIISIVDVNYIRRINKEREYIKIEMVNGVRVDGARGRMDKNIKTLNMKRFANGSLILAILGYALIIAGICLGVIGLWVYSVLAVLLGIILPIIAFIIGDEVVDLIEKDSEKDSKNKYPFYKTAKASKLLGLILLCILAILGIAIYLLPLILLI
jgi:hypothetical protein